MPSEMYNPKPEETPEQQAYRESVGRFVDITDKLVTQKVNSALRALGYDPDNLSAAGPNGQAYNPDDPQFRQEYLRYMGIRSGIEAGIATRLTGHALHTVRPGEAKMILPPTEDKPPVVSTFKVEGTQMMEQGADYHLPMTLAQVQGLTSDLEQVYQAIEENS